MTLLIPDSHRTNQDDFIWCIPVERVKWNKWFELSKKFKHVTKTQPAVRYMTRVEGSKKIQSIIMLPTEDQSDDDVTTACAWLRITKEFNERIYVLRCTDTPLKGAQLVERVIGANPKSMLDVDDDNPTNRNEQEK